MANLPKPLSVFPDATFAVAFVDRTSNIYHPALESIILGKPSKEYPHLISNQGVPAEAFSYWRTDRMQQEIPRHVRQGLTMNAVGRSGFTEEERHALEGLMIDFSEADGFYAPAISLPGEYLGRQETVSTFPLSSFGPQVRNDGSIDTFLPRIANAAVVAASYRWHAHVWEKPFTTDSTTPPR